MFADREMFIVEIKDTLSGEICCYVETSFEFNEYQWTEGNFGCDCNGGLFFMRECKDEDISVDDSPSCNCNENRYTLNAYDMHGDIIYREFEATS